MVEKCQSLYRLGCIIALCCALLTVNSPKVLAEDLPSLELLEFLGGWDEGEGEPMDPLEWLEFFEQVSIEAEENAGTASKPSGYSDIVNVDVAGTGESDSKRETELDNQVIGAQSNGVNQEHED